MNLRCVYTVRVDVGIGPDITHKLSFVVNRHGSTTDPAAVAQFDHRITAIQPCSKCFRGETGRNGTHNLPSAVDSFDGDAGSYRADILGRVLLRTFGRSADNEDGHQGNRDQPTISRDKHDHLSGRRSSVTGDVSPDGNQHTPALNANTSAVGNSKKPEQSPLAVLLSHATE